MRDARQRLVHRHMHVGIAGDALHVAERLLDRLAERDADVLGGVVVVDVQVALGLDGQVDAGMARQQVEHVVEEADAGRDRRRAGAVEIDRDLDVGFLGGALDRTFAHERVSSRRLELALSRAPFIRGLPASPLRRPELRLPRIMLSIISKHGIRECSLPPPTSGTAPPS